ncbi:MAG TPA: hypothetical protein VF860_16035 [Candidatus Acidoferrales bacterium]
MFTGQVVINGVNDKDLVKILEVKIKHERSLQLNPQQLQVVGTSQPNVMVYNNVVLGWQNEDGLEAVHSIISILLKKGEHTEKAAAGGGAQ